jgi:hypothetical protein
MPALYEVLLTCDVDKTPISKVNSLDDCFHVVVVVGVQMRTQKQSVLYRKACHGTTTSPTKLVTILDLALIRTVVWANHGHGIWRGLAVTLHAHVQPNFVYVIIILDTTHKWGDGQRLFDWFISYLTCCVDHN